MCVTIFRIISFNAVYVYVCRLNDETRRLYESGWRYNGMKGWQGTTVYVCVSPVIWHYYAPPLKNGYIRLYDVVRVCGGVLVVGGTAEGNKINLPVICFLFFLSLPPRSLPSFAPSSPHVATHSPNDLYNVCACIQYYYYYYYVYLYATVSSCSYIQYVPVRSRVFRARSCIIIVSTAKSRRNIALVLGRNQGLKTVLTTQHRNPQIVISLRKIHTSFEHTNSSFNLQNSAFECNSI